MSMPDPSPDLELELSDEDVLDAMRRIPGYIDIFVDDFRTIYHLAHRHAVQRATAHLRAGAMMRRDVQALAPDMMLDAAARAIAASGHKGLPVTDGDGRVVGMLTEADFLRRLGATSFLELLLTMLEDGSGLSHRCHETPVRVAMSAPATCVAEDAAFGDMLRAFDACGGRGLPVIDTAGRLRGLLLRKDFLGAAHLERLL